MNKSELAVYMHEYYEENKAYISRYKKRWYRKNAEKVKARNRARRLEEKERRAIERARHKEHKKQKGEE